MSVTFPAGFRASGVTAGLKPSGHPDLGLLVGDPGTTAAGLFTTNRVAAAPVVVSRRRLDGAPRAVLVNSGQANAATGSRGLADAATATAAVAERLGVGEDAVLPASTGVIGEPLHLDRLVRALPGLVDALSVDGGPAFARAIMTTDTVEKQATSEAGAHRVGGCAKGVGMISPNLATMLTFVTTDAAVAPAALRRLAEEQLKPRFDALTVDACTSTNDTVLLFASGAAGSDPVTPGGPGWAELSDGVAAVGESLLAQLAADAEGGHHVLLVDVTGAASEEEARIAARAVADSPLVKTAVYGGDPNPGRILQAVGASGAAMDPGRIDITLGDVPLVDGGVIAPEYFADGPLQAAARACMGAPEIAVRISLGSGEGRSRAIGCDLSYDYVRINGEYTT